MDILHPSNRRILSNLAKDVPQSILISGQAGLSFQSAIDTLTRDSMVIPIRPQLTKDGTVSDLGIISIEQIRDIVHDARIKRTADYFVVIYNADKMTVQAQNAFLKLLEEPGVNIHYILTSSLPGLLLPTILSRVQTVSLLPLPMDKSIELLDKIGVNSEEKRKQLAFMAGGLPDDLIRLTEDDEYFESRTTSMKDARTLLQATSYEKMLVINRYSKSDRVNQLIDDAITIVRHTIKTKSSGSLVDTLELLLDISHNIIRNASPRLQLLRLVV